MSVLSTLNELAFSNSRLFKDGVLAREVGNTLLCDVFIAAYNPLLNYWIATIPEYRVGGSSTMGLKAALHTLNKLSTREVTGIASIQLLSDTLSSLPSDDAEALSRIVGRDLRCGVSHTTINKVWPGCIPTHNVMLAHKDISGITYPCYAQVKYDGARCHLHYDGITVIPYSRSGKLGVGDVFTASAKALMGWGDSIR